MQKDPIIFFEHIKESIGWIETEVKGLTYKKFLANVPIQDAVIRRFEIIGEAVKNLPAGIKIKYPETPWQKISGLRDKLIHGYFGVDLELVWSIIKKDLPQLKIQIEKMLKIQGYRTQCSSCDQS